MAATSPSSQSPHDAAAGVIARPPLLYLSALLLGLSLDRIQPLAFEVPAAAPVRWMIGGGLILLGLAIVFAGLRNFSRAVTPYRSNQPVRALVTSGIHGWSRNPMYVGLFLIYAGSGLAASSPWVFVLALPLAIVMRYGIVAREEAYLERYFGEAYRDYKVRVRRWL